MIFGWESQEKRLQRFLRIPAKKKLEWLNQMHEFISKAYTKRQREIYQRLRESR